MVLVKWILIEWTNGTFDVVNIKAVHGDIKPQELTTGKGIAVLRKNGIRRAAKVVMTSDDRKFLFQQKRYMTNPKINNQVAGPSKVSQPSNITRNRHSWDADNSWSTDDSSEEIPKKRRSTRRRTNGTYKSDSPKYAPSVKCEAASKNCQSVEKLKPYTSQSSSNCVKVMPQKKCVDTGTSTDYIITYNQKSQTDCTTDVINGNAGLTISLRTAQRAYLMSVVDKYGPSIMSNLDINNDAELDNMFNIVNERVNAMKSSQVFCPSKQLIKDDQKNDLKVESNAENAVKTYNRKRKFNSDQHFDSNKNISSIKVSKKNTSSNIEASRSEQAKSPSTYSNNTINCEPSTSKERSSATKKTPMKHNIARCSNSTSPDYPNMMVPLGSGHTVIRRSQFDQINWDSHTMATRQLLTAVFPRSILATHSLTGKRSPAFQHLPPKSCLDQRKVTDIIMTVTKMCQVKENLVRSAITVKCSDENKMKKQKETKETGSNSLNLSTESNSGYLNQSWDSDQENQAMN